MIPEAAPTLESVTLSEPDLLGETVVQCAVHRARAELRLAQARDALLSSGWAGEPLDTSLPLSYVQPTKPRTSVDQDHCCDVRSVRASIASLRDSLLSDLEGFEAATAETAIRTFAKSALAIIRDAAGKPALRVGAVGAPQVRVAGVRNKL